MQHASVILSALNQYLGDDHIRAQRAFSRYSPEQMKQPYGYSGQSAQEVLDDYVNRAKRIEAAIKYVKDNIHV